MSSEGCDLRREETRGEASSDAFCTADWHSEFQTLVDAARRRARRGRERVETAKIEVTKRGAAAVATRGTTTKIRRD